MNLQTRLDACLASLDHAYKSSMDAAIAHLRRTSVASQGKQVGDRAPDFALPDRSGMPVGLFDLLRAGPVVLSFFRGEWCSFCRLEMEALLEVQPRIAALGARLMMVSPQGPSETLLRRAEGVEGVTVLRDSMNGVGLRYGLVFRMPDVLRDACLAAGVDLSRVYGTNAWLLPIPATYVIEPDGTVALAHVDPDFSHRLDPDVILAVVGELRDRATRV